MAAPTGADEAVELTGLALERFLLKVEEGDQQPEPEPEPEPEPAQRIPAARQPDSRLRVLRPRRQAAGLQPTPQPWRSCLDRPYVQKELGWARKYNKKIIVIFEKDERRAGFFDFDEAWKKYCGTEWEFILDIDAEPYQRDEVYAEGMVGKIMQKAAKLAQPAPASEPLNEPGGWDCFLSHHQAAGGDQAQTTHLRLKDKGWAVWYDNAMLDRSTAAMEEGVRNSRCFVLFLTGDAPAATK